MGVRTELKCFDTGHLHFINQLVEENPIDDDPIFQFCSGTPWGAAVDAETISYIKRYIPKTVIELLLVSDGCKCQWLLNQFCKEVMFELV